MSEQNGVTPTAPQAADLPIDPLSEPRCEAVTRSGQPCRNRPLDGQRFCHKHAALAGTVSAVPSATVALAGSSDAAPVELPADAPFEELRIGGADGAAEPQGEGIDTTVVQELEVEVRSHESAEPQKRDLAAGLLRLVRENLMRMPVEAAQRALAMVRENVSSDYLDPDFWRGISMVLRYQLDETVALVRRRMRGEYVTDEFGMDQELVDLVRPFSSFLYRTWWRVSVTGLENVPDEGRALLVANHGGVVPWDSVMIATAIIEDHSSPRVPRTLYPSVFQTLPGVERALATFGQAADTPENAVRLLEQGQLVCVFPEGVKGLGKLFWNRYKLQRFRRSGSVGLAIQTGAPIVPVAVVGSEETYPMLADIEPLAELLRLPFFPVTPLFPALGPLGLIPLPSKWAIAFGEPIATGEYGPDAADDPELVARLCDDVRERIKGLLAEQLAGRKSAFR